VCTSGNNKTLTHTSVHVHKLLHLTPLLIFRVLLAGLHNCTRVTIVSSQLYTCHDRVFTTVHMSRSCLHNCTRVTIVSRCQPVDTHVLFPQQQTVMH